MEPSVFAMPLLIGILDYLGQMISDLGFTFQVMIFAYITFWLYINLRDAQVLFGLGTIIAAFFIFVQPIVFNVFVIIFVVFVTMGNHLQILVQFGLYPLLRFFGIELEHPEMAEQQKMHAIELKVRNGQDLLKEEEEFLEKVQKREMQYQKKMNERMMRNMVG